MRNRTRQAFWIIDAVMAIAIVGVLTVVLVSALSQHRRAAERLAQSRAAVRLAEQTLLSLQSGHAPNHPGVQLIPLDTPAPHGFRWVEVRTRIDRQSATLVGLAPTRTTGGAP